MARYVLKCVLFFVLLIERLLQVDSEQHHEPSSESQDYKSQICSIHNSYQVFLVYPTQEIEVHEKWHYFLSVSLNHPLFIKVKVNYVRYIIMLSQTAYSLF